MKKSGKGLILKQKRSIFHFSMYLPRQIGIKTAKTVFYKQFSLISVEHSIELSNSFIEDWKKIINFSNLPSINDLM